MHCILSPRWPLRLCPAFRCLRPLDEEEGWKPTHIKLADEADMLLLAPATANTIAKVALGLANDA